ncbi:hypothetical protein B0H16DRAFT_1898911 [Mycena metata]|uniref:Uncharacterized protein n=1 Tax=Mycena metata TaxID=1033252 RepID=A0AAD7H8J2_9AGAR|nr:hypothetical protein B0H16DRAFT_1898911 [Mycena metata]
MLYGSKAPLTLYGSRFPSKIRSTSALVHVRRMVLDPTRLRRTDYVDLSRSKWFPLHLEEPRVHVHYFRLKKQTIPFPPRTAGFFYYYRPKHLPVTASGVRFRVAPSSTAFPIGFDLVRPDGQPWEITLRAIASTQRGPVMKEFLVNQGLVTKAELELCAALCPSRGRGERIVLHYFGQPFLVRFDKATYVQVVCGSELLTTDIRVFHEQRARRTNEYPYSGSALVRFELAESAEQPRAAVLRVLKMIQPPKLRIAGYDGHLPAPVEGELVVRRKMGPGAPLGPWTRKLDSKLGKPLGLLLDRVKMPTQS